MIVMRTRWSIAGVALVLALLSAPSVSAAAKSDRAALDQAFTDVLSGLRHNDGAKACGRMTLALRSVVIAGIVKQVPAAAGEGCVRLLSVYGREIYVAQKKTRGRATFHGACADWHAVDGRFHAVKQSGRWLLAGAGHC